MRQPKRGICKCHAISQPCVVNFHWVQLLYSYTVTLSSEEVGQELESKSCAPYHMLPTQQADPQTVANFYCAQPLLLIHKDALSLACMCMYMVATVHMYTCMYAFTLLTQFLATRL